MKSLFSKYLILFFILSIFLFSLSGCYNDKNIDNLGYVVALGFDKGTNENLKLSFQLSVTGKNEGTSSSQSSSTTVATVEASSINSAINLLDNYFSKKINLSHCKVIVFSEEVAIEGLSEEIYTLMNDIEVGPDSNVIISKCNAEYFLNNSKPVLEQLSARYYEAIVNSSKYTGYSEDITLSNFFSNLNDSSSECFAILGNINEPKSSQNSNNVGRTTTASNANLEDSSHIENIGLAVFHNDKLVGELNSIETLCHMIITNNVQDFVISIPNPFKDNSTIDLNVEANKKTKNTVKLINNSPYIESNIHLHARIASIDKDSKYLEQENLDILEKYANSYLENQITEYLYKTSASLNSDINGFGTHILKSFLTFDDWSNYNWLNNYKNSFFNVTVHTDIGSSYQLLQT